MKRMCILTLICPSPWTIRKLTAPKGYVWRPTNLVRWKSTIWRRCLFFPVYQMPPGTWYLLTCLQSLISFSCQTLQPTLEPQEYHCGGVFVVNLDDGVLWDCGLFPNCTVMDIWVEYTFQNVAMTPMILLLLWEGTWLFGSREAFRRVRVLLLSRCAMYYFHTHLEMRFSMSLFGDSTVIGLLSIRLMLATIALDISPHRLYTLSWLCSLRKVVLWHLDWDGSYFPVYGGVEVQDMPRELAHFRSWELEVVGGLTISSSGQW